MTVWATPRTVIRAAHTLLAPHVRHDRQRRPARHAWLRGILKAHSDAYEQYVRVTEGLIG